MSDRNHVFQSGKPDGQLHVWIYDARTGKKHKIFVDHEEAQRLGYSLVHASHEAKKRKEKGST